MTKKTNKKAELNTEEAIVNFFKENKKPSDKEIHNFANNLGINKHKFEEEIYKLLGALINGESLSPLGKHKDVSDDKFDSEELARGIEVELEHTDDKNIAKEVAKDHLTELPNYYTLLDKMEAEGKKALEKESCEIEGCEVYQKVSKTLIKIAKKL